MDTTKLEKPDLKKRIRELRGQIPAAMSAGKPRDLKKLRREVKRLKRRTRRLAAIKKAPEAPTPAPPEGGAAG